MNNSNTVDIDNTSHGNPNPSNLECWVRLYQDVPPDDISSSMTNDDGTRTILTLRAIMDVFPIRPVPQDIDGLCMAVQVEYSHLISQVSPIHFKVYESMSSATDVLTLPSTTMPLLRGHQVPLGTTSLQPLVVVVVLPTMSAVASPAEAFHEAAGQAVVDENEEATESEEDYCKEVLGWANEFATAIMSGLEDIPGSNGNMHLMRDVMDLENGNKRDVILRGTTIDFWNQCVEYLYDTRYQARLCVVGTPGIGKTTSTAFAIRTLLQNNKTVVYHIRGNHSTGWYYEFVPKRNVLVTQVTVKAFPECTSIRNIPSLRRSTTCYIVDPGETKDSCSPSCFAPKFMLVASPDDRHWGGSDFTKKRSKTRSEFKFFPVWNLEEIQL
jgi:hypothetical protein